MSEEKKEEKGSAGQQEAAKTEALKAADGKPQAPKQDIPQAAAQAKAPDAKKEDGKISKERAANCSVCNKSIRKKRCYYRNGKYFCTKRCWKTTVKKDKAAGPDAAKV